MNIQEFVDKQMKQAREKTFADSPQLTLGEIIEQLEKMELKYDENTYKKVYFDFGSAVPTSLDSWRGVYAELALGYRLTGYDETERGSSNSNDANVLLEELRSAVGKSFDGWKGGEFTMRVDTPVWVANSGNSGNTGIVGILDKSWCIIILTQYCEA